MLAWMCGNRELVWDVTLWNHIKSNIAITTMMTTWCMRVRGLNSLADYFDVETWDIQVGNVATKRDIRGRVTL